MNVNTIDEIKDINNCIIYDLNATNNAINNITNDATNDVTNNVKNKKNIKKKKKNICNFETCRARIFIGTPECKYCNHLFCIHHLPIEGHDCINKKDCHDEQANINKNNLLKNKIIENKIDKN